MFIHDHFEHGVYDYTDPNRSAEAELIRQCMATWQAPGPDGRRGNIRAILRTIFNSDLFRSHGGSLQKIKTPLEFVASSVRALRSANANGTFTATTDGFSFISPLSRMGSMSLFNRADPDGYPEFGPPWISAGTLAERLRFTQSFLTAATTANRPTDSGNCFSDPVALLKRSFRREAGTTRVTSRTFSCPSSSLARDERTWTCTGSRPSTSSTRMMTASPHHSSGACRTPVQPMIPAFGVWCPC